MTESSLIFNIAGVYIATWVAQFAHCSPFSIRGYIGTKIVRQTVSVHEAFKFAVIFRHYFLAAFDDAAVQNLSI